MLENVFVFGKFLSLLDEIIIMFYLTYQIISCEKRNCSIFDNNDFNSYYVFHDQFDQPSSNAWAVPGPIMILMGG